MSESRDDPSRTTEQLDGEPERLRTDIIRALDKAKADIIKWVAGLLIIHGASIVALVKLLPGPQH